MGKADAIDCSQDEVRTQQSAAQECDINFIVERAKRGVVPQETGRQPMYGDFTQVPTDLRECMVKVVNANNAFMSLDAQVRKRFENDPAQMLDFLNDPKNREEAVKLGLVKAPEPPPKPDPVVEEIKNLRTDLKANSGTKKSKSKDDDE